MKESRLFGILYYLLDKGYSTAPELAVKFEVSVRTVLRDIDALSENGIPVYAERGKNGGIFLLSDFVLRGAILSDEEKDEIISALQSLNITKDASGSRALTKLSALFKNNADNWLEVDYSRWGVGKRGLENEKFKLLKTAVIGLRCVKIRYAGSDGAITERTVEPIKLVYRSRAWYLYAFCRKKQGFRIFKLNRILDIEITGERFERKQFPENADYGACVYLPVVLRFKREISYRVYDEFDVSLISRCENGDLVVSAEMPQDGWLLGFLLSIGTGVEIISPDSLKNEVAEAAKKIYEKHKT